MLDLPKSLLSKLNFKSAMTDASKPNDLLPSRLEDKVGGELGKEFVVNLENMIEEGSYVPDEASFIHVPKPGLTTRPAALLTLADRLIYETLVDCFKKQIEKKLVSKEYLKWPRAEYVKKDWNEFENAPIKAGEKYTVCIDITAFYDTIDHTILSDLIVEIIGEREFAKAIKSFLNKIMRSRKGLPQGLVASDTLATLYLQPLDTAMLRSGFHYWRHGDDIRMAAENISKARESISIAEVELRKIGLVLNSSKCTITRTEQYEESLSETNKVYEIVKQKIYSERVEDVSSDSTELERLMDAAELHEQMKWDLFYHNSISIEEVIEEISEHLEPNEVEISEGLFKETLKGVPGSDNPLPKEQFHVQLKKSLLVLAAGKSDVALNHSSSLIGKYPEKTELVCNYLLSLVSLKPKEVMLQVEDILNSDLFLTPWQRAWLFRVVLENPENLQSTTKERILDICNDQDSHWLERVEGFKIMANLRELPFKTLTQSWELAPKVYRPDLIAAANTLSDSCEKSKRFLDGAQHSPIERVVARHCRRETSSKS